MSLICMALYCGPPQMLDHQLKTIVNFALFKAHYKYACLIFKINI